jgi:hypothetical protein
MVLGKHHTSVEPLATQWDGTELMQRVGQSHPGPQSTRWTYVDVAEIHCPECQEDTQRRDSEGWLPDGTMVEQGASPGLG